MDPKQWRQELPPEVREVLHSGITVSAPTGAKQAVWSALSAQLPAATTAAAAGGLSVLSLLKPLAVGLAIGTVGAVGVLEIRGGRTPLPPSASALAQGSRSTRAPSPPSSLSPSPTTEPTIQPAPSPALRPAAPAPAEDAPSAAPRAPVSESITNGESAGVAAFPNQTAGSAQESATLLESRRLNQARAALHAGNARSAIAQLDALGAEFPNGVLGQERDALRIEALLGLGERQQARDLAQRFLARYPRSPHAAAVERALH